MNNIDILEELKEWFNNFDLDSIKHKPEEYIQAISNLIAENKELKEMLKHRIKYTNTLEKDYWRIELTKAIAKRNILQEILDERNNTDGN